MGRVPPLIRIAHSRTPSQSTSAGRGGGGGRRGGRGEERRRGGVKILPLEDRSRCSHRTILLDVPYEGSMDVLQEREQLPTLDLRQVLEREQPRMVPEMGVTVQLRGGRKRSRQLAGKQRMARNLVHRNCQTLADLISTLQVHRCTSIYGSVHV